MNCRLILATLACALAQTALADDVRLYRDGEIPDAREVAAMLGAKPAVKFRSIRLLADGKPAEIAAAPEAEAPKSFALPLQFGFNSSELTPTVMAQLDAVAEGIRMASAAKVVVEGHADATGPDLYNDDLSRRRALSVKRYLVERHRLDEATLVVVGQGEKKPWNPADPYAPENRRVQFRAG